MKFYRLRHKASGLFYKPSKHRSKVNLSKAGKTYSKLPPVTQIKSCGRVLLGFNGEYGKNEGRYCPGKMETTFNDCEWEIVCYETTETAIPIKEKSQ